MTLAIVLTAKDLFASNLLQLLEQSGVVEVPGLRYRNIPAVVTTAVGQMVCAHINLLDCQCFCLGCDFLVLCTTCPHIVTILYCVCNYMSHYPCICCYFMIIHISYLFSYVVQQTTLAFLGMQPLSIFWHCWLPGLSSHINFY